MISVGDWVGTPAGVGTVREVFGENLTLTNGQTFIDKTVDRLGGS